MTFTFAAIEVRHLIKRYPGAAANAVDDLSFSVRRGEIFGLLGPNGAGKTTTIGILTTSIIPTGGNVSIMGKDVVHDAIGVKCCISVVPQRNNLDQSLSVQDILTFHASYHGVPRAQRKANAVRLLAEFGLEQRRKEKVSSYSGGMVQRVMIARALMHTPDVLFLDEPTNNLDPQARLFLWERIQNLREQGLTILLTTHDMEEASRLCDRIAIMDHGRILVCDEPEALCKLVPGGIALELRVRIPSLVATGSVRSSSLLQNALAALPGVSKVEVVTSSKTTAHLSVNDDLSILRLYAEHAPALVSRAIGVLGEWNAELCDLHLIRPGLEDVFIYLTGRKLRS